MKKIVNRISRAIYLAALCLAIPLKAELQPDMKLTGAKSGVIKGELIQKGREGLWAVYAYNLEIQMQTDGSSGQATGKKVFKPLSVVVPAGPLYTPALHNLLASNESLKSVEIRFWQASNQGQESIYVTVRLTNARISALRDWVANIKDPEFLKYPQQHQVEFTFDKIEWVSGKVTVTDGPGSTTPQ